MINAFLKLPFDFKDICKIYPPSVEDTLINKKFILYKTLLTISQEDLEDEFLKDENDMPLIFNDMGKASQEIKNKKVPSPFDFLIIKAAEDKDGFKLVQEAFEFFTKQKVSIILKLREIWFGDIEQILKDSKDINDLLKIKK